MQQYMLGSQHACQDRVAFGTCQASLTAFLTSLGSTTGVAVGDVKGEGKGGKLTGVIFWVLLGLWPAAAPGPGFAPSTW